MVASANLSNNFFEYSMYLSRFSSSSKAIIFINIWVVSFVIIAFIESDVVLPNLPSSSSNTGKFSKFILPLPIPSYLSFSSPTVKVILPFTLSKS